VLLNEEADRTIWHSSLRYSFGPKTELAWNTWIFILHHVKVPI